MFAVSPQLKLHLLLKDRDRKILDPLSYYTLLPVKNKFFSKKEIDLNEDQYLARRRARSKAKTVVKDQLSLVCSVGGWKRIFNLFPMPEETKQNKFKQKDITAIELLETRVKADPVLI